MCFRFFFLNFGTQMCLEKFNFLSKHNLNFLVLIVNLIASTNEFDDQSKTQIRSLRSSKLIDLVMKVWIYEQQHANIKANVKNYPKVLQWTKM